MGVHQITSFYFFKATPASRVAEIETLLNAINMSAEGGINIRLRGLVLIGVEGINATISGSPHAITSFKTLVKSIYSDEIDFKDSFSLNHPFRDYRVKIREEIVTLGRPDLVPSGDNGHLTASEWHQALSEPDVLVLDTRNTYETEIGKFKNAVDLRLEEFQEFPDRVREMKIPKDQKVLMYCTGGIRCEKAFLEMKEQGYENVHQLKGGILEYLKEFPDQEFEGECFVFDYRVAVDQQLQPSQNFKFCPHCGQPANEKIACVLCGTDAYVCQGCLDKASGKASCSKNCAYHVSIGSRSKRPHQQELAKRQTLTQPAE
jgi:UPF0176 protein